MTRLGEKQQIRDLERALCDVDHHHNEVGCQVDLRGVQLCLQQNLIWLLFFTGKRRGHVLEVYDNSIAIL